MPNWENQKKNTVVKIKQVIYHLIDELSNSKYMLDFYMLDYYRKDLNISPPYCSN